MPPEIRTLCLDDGSQVESRELLRALPGKRLVCAGERAGAAVIVKLYLDPRRGAAHAQRERAGLAAFAGAGIAAPEVLYVGSDREGHPVVVLRRIESATPFGDALQDPAAFDELMPLLLDVLAAHHAAGLYQADLHLDNFLFADGRIYSLDGAAVEVGPAPLGEADSLANLALLFGQLPMAFDRRSLEHSRRYAQQRGWAADWLLQRLPALIDAARARRWQERSGKIFRNCTAVAHHRSDGREVFVMRSEEAALGVLLADPDSSCPHDRSLRLKDGNTSTVWQTRVGGLAVVVKRYNVKNGRHALKLALRESRARVSWRNAHRLRLYGIDTPQPLACSVPRSCMRAGPAYFFSAAVDGVDLRDWVGRHHADTAALAEMAERVARLFADLKRLRLTHGDTKATNFLLAGNRLCLLDLDSMRQHRSGLAFARAWRRDIARFLDNWPGQPRVQAAMRAAIIDASAQ